ncbi:LacI family transcriptional regulator [Motilibacter rhizosphaerae]|uniref:LacI family transcriptional regulator n=1 Tax=Motilibacter rhizosphaerae TaxID=598652 RepID=A0A4Q7NQM6_9ACTN|nr:LacI family DNA-binding transcriptional regulator [Motilibacter rhizosphaerae]RZS87442.1 LacI family transcriptional regulator [Motilibacter rhizosphaerae]
MARRAAGVPASVREIAAESGVSIATVSRVLRGSDGVAEHTAARVRDALGRLSGASTARPRAVFVRCPYVLTDYFGLVVSSIAETLELHDLPMVLEAGEAAQRRSLLPRVLGPGDVAGIITILPLEEGAALAALGATGTPLVVVDPRTPLPPRVPAISAAHFPGARSLTAHLLELGHRRIGLVAGPPTWAASDARLAGHRAALGEAGLLLDEALLRHSEATVEDGEQAAASLLDLAVPPTALVCFNDKVAVGALRVARARGLRVPEDLSVCGFDDIDLARATTPELTTVRQPLQEMGRMAVAQVVRMVSGHSLEALHVELATTLVVRGSTGRAPV